MFTLYLIDNEINKALTRFTRDTGTSHVCHLTLDTPIQSEYLIPKVSENKEHLIQLIYNYLVAKAILIFSHKLTLDF